MVIKKNQPTIYDVARSAGVSISTVSRVLNNPERVNESTRVQVLASIDKLGFVPKAEARARALRSSGRVGVITPFFTAPSFVQRLRGVASILTESNYELVIFTVDTLERLHNYLDTIPLTHNLDGLILISVRIDGTTAERMMQHHLETVLIEYPLNVFSSVEIDDEEGGKIAARYLVRKGYQNFAFVGETNFPKYGINPINSRLLGFRGVLSDLRKPFREENIWETPYHVDATRYVALERFKNTPKPVAIFSATDLQAVGVLKAARQLGLRVPDDVAILGFDDLDMADYIGLSTVRQPLDESGRVAAELLFSRVTNPSRSVQHIRLPLTLIERETT
ncbi:MAG: LacI family DNA-binding transcriptional regulator [Chloroflexota bacterium]|jgi:LacI family transcriptional regulator